MAKAKADDSIGAEDVKAARQASRLTQEQAAPVVYASLDTWQNWEQGRNAMPPAVYELFMLKTGQFTLRELVGGSETEPAVMRLRLRTGRVIDVEIKDQVVRDLAAKAEEAHV